MRKLVFAAIAAIAIPALADDPELTPEEAAIIADIRAHERAADFEHYKARRAARRAEAMSRRRAISARMRHRVAAARQTPVVNPLAAGIGYNDPASRRRIPAITTRGIRLPSAGWNHPANRFPTGMVHPSHALKR